MGELKSYCSKKRNRSIWQGKIQKFAKEVINSNTAKNGYDCC